MSDVNSSVHLRKIQDAYFRIVEERFGKTFSVMQNSLDNPDQCAQSLAKDPDVLKAWPHWQDGLIEDIREFWDTHASAFLPCLRDLKGLKMVYGGDIFPRYHSAITHFSSLYADTLILPDPILRIGGLFKMMPPDQQLGYMLKHALNILLYRGCALADCTPRP